MWFLAVALLLVSGFHKSQSAVGYGYQYVAPGEPQLCLVDGKQYQPGETWRNSPDEGQCYSKSCSLAGPNRLMIHIVGCGVMAVDAPGCTVKSDLSKPHPDCCPRAVCNHVLNTFE